MNTALTSYKAMSRLSPHINAGASARLNLQPMVSDLSGEAHAAFCHGWRSTDEAENRAGRTMPPATPRPLIKPQAHLTGHGHVAPRSDGVKMRCGGPGICAECSREAATSMVGG